jgi:hypothetical protein
MAHYTGKKNLRRFEHINQVGIDFLVADLNVGLTFLQIADVTGSRTGRARDFEKALQVYRTVVRFKSRVILSPDDRIEINGKLEELRYRLEKAGVSCEV